MRFSLYTTKSPCGHRPVPVCAWAAQGAGPRWKPFDLFRLSCAYFVWIFTKQFKPFSFLFFLPWISVTTDHLQCVWFISLCVVRPWISPSSFQSCWGRKKRGEKSSNSKVISTESMGLYVVFNPCQLCALHSPLEEVQCQTGLWLSPWYPAAATSTPSPQLWTVDLVSTWIRYFWDLDSTSSGPSIRVTFCIGRNVDNLGLFLCNLMIWTFD